MTAAPVQDAWSDAVLAAAMLAVDPRGLKGIHLRARAGAVRDAWLECLAAMLDDGTPLRRISAGISPARLSGGLDIGATIEAGRPVSETGVLAATDGGVLVLAMAERLDPHAAGMISSALDEGVVRIERDGISATPFARIALVAMDEGIDAEEALAQALADRLGLRIDLNTIGWREIGMSIDREVVRRARAQLASVTIADGMVDALCTVALSAGIRSMRAALQLVAAARASAALRASDMVEVEDAATALRLVLGMQAAAAPPAEEDQAEPPPPEPQSPDQPDQDRQAQSGDQVKDTVVEAVEAVLPEHLLAGLAPASSRRSPGGAAGKAGAMRSKARRGRAIGITDKPPVPGARLDVLSTLRQAAPWQRLRAGPASATDAPAQSRLRIRKDDFRYLRLREKMGTMAIFAVDASGSAAVERLAETKGAVELLLAECYVRRDSVALIAFRGRSAETLLEPTRSLTRAKRSLSALPGGGGTPLAGGILASLTLAMGAARKGQSAVAVFLTDGRGNVALDGTSGKERVTEDTARAARLFRGAGVRSILIDTAQRPQARAQALAADLGAEYLPLPRGGARAMAREIGTRMEG
jgi:magnesium chelatase subunit D